MLPVRQLQKTILTPPNSRRRPRIIQRTLSTRGPQKQQQQQQQQQLNQAPLGPRPLGRLDPKPAASLLERVVYYPLNSLTRLALRAIFQLGRQPANNAQLATTSINRALRYSVGTTASQRVQGFATMEAKPTSEASKGDSASRERLDEEKAQGEKDELAALENHRLGNTLDSLREAYSGCHKKASSTWLDFANKSCYIYLYRGGGEPNQSVGAFDLDGTLIKPKSNKRIPRSATDWDLFSVWTKIKLQQCLRDNRARFVIFTNQNGVGLEIVPLEEVQHRIELVTKRLDIPCTVFVAIERDSFRKPKTGMFQLFAKSFNDSLPVDFASSFYCGDAIGYPSHSDADIKFAQQLGFPFLTPEKFLRGVKPKLVT